MLTASPALAVELSAIVQAALEKLKSVHPRPEAPAPTISPIIEVLPATPLPDPVPLVDAEVARSSKPAHPDLAVRNDRSGILPVVATRGSARCGWKFNSKPHTMVSPAPSRGKGIWCSNCWPEPREGAEASEGSGDSD